MLPCQKCKKEFSIDELFTINSKNYCFSCFVLRNSKSKKTELSFNTHKEEEFLEPPTINSINSALPYEYMM